MSQSNVEKVRALVMNDPALQARLGAAESEKEMVRALIGIGTEKGLAFSETELEAWKAGEGASVELDEEQLMSISGGRNRGLRAKESYSTSYGNSIFCGFCGSQSGSFGT